MTSKSGVTVAGDSPATVDKAGAMLRAGALVSFPTETVYGLGADATNGQAVARIFEAKKRPSFNPLIVHVADEDAARRIAVFDARADIIASTLWPGPLTLILPKTPRSGLSDLVTAGLDTVAVRIPDHALARAILKAANVPVAAPSANPSGRISPTTPQHVANGLGDVVDLIVAGGRTRVGIESTILDLSGHPARLLRPGAVLPEDIESLIGPIVRAESDGPDAAESEKAEAGRPIAPGQLRSHYAPNAPVRLNARTAQNGEVLITFGPDLRQGDDVINLSETGDPIEAAANLFAALTAADRPGITGIAVSPIPGDGIGAAINDRLRRAAAPRR